ncbi:MFS transporter [Peribacillus sp. NPDC097198]|uniref:MFS transporter n=1 Tax=Peribacillus sp. NPDC097198 TaxID=3364397 RepID=UPI0038241D46
MRRSPIDYLRIAGILDGISLLTLLLIAMPLKYFADLPLAVTINGSIHGGIFLLYIGSILYAAIRIQWSISWSLAAVFVAFIPFGNFIFDVYLKKVKDRYPVKPFQMSWIIYSIIFFSFIDLFAQLPVMSTFAKSVGASAFIAGIVVGLYSFTNSFGNIASGILTDKIGPLSMMLFGLAATSASLFSYHFVDDPLTLLIVRSLHGFFGGLIVPAAFTLLANTTAHDKQGSKSAVTGSFVGIAAIIGPAFSGIMASKTSVPNVFTVIGALGVLLLVCSFLLRQVHVKKQEREASHVSFNWNRDVQKAFMGAFFLMFSQGALAYLLPLHVEALGYSSRMSGTLMSMFGIVAVFLFILPTNRVFNRVDPVYTMLIGVAVLAISQMLIGQMTTTLTLYLVMILYGIGFSSLFPSINTLLIQSTTPETRGQAYGYFYAFFSIGVVVGSSVLGFLRIGIAGGFMLTGVVLTGFFIVVLFDIRKRVKSKKISDFSMK